MRIGLIAEGLIDYELLPALLKRIAEDRAGFSWPIPTDNIADRLHIRKQGAGGVLESVRKLVKVLDRSQDFSQSFFVILLDYKTKDVQGKIKRLIRHRDRFILGLAIREIEAWWLGDRRSTLSWLQLNDSSISGTRYGKNRYKAENDDNPKRTLNELTRLSEVVDQFYGNGNTTLAREFAETWGEHARLSEIESQCPSGFGKFCQDATNGMRWARASLSGS